MGLDNYLFEDKFSIGSSEIIDLEEERSFFKFGVLIACYNFIEILSQTNKQGHFLVRSI